MDHIFHAFNEVFTILKYIHSQKISVCKLCAVLRDESLYLTVIDFITRSYKRDNFFSGLCLSQNH